MKTGLIMSVVMIAFFIAACATTQTKTDDVITQEISAQDITDATQISDLNDIDQVLAELDNLDEELAFDELDNLDEELTFE